MKRTTRTRRPTAERADSADRRHITITDPTGREAKRFHCLTVYDLTTAEIAEALKRLHDQRQLERLSLSLAS